MSTTFRIRRSHRNAALACLIGFLIWAALAIFVVATDPNLHDRWLALFLLAGIPVLMATLSVWSLIACSRETLTIEDDHLIFNGVIRSRELLLPDVAEAHWRIGHSGGSLVLRTDARRFVIRFEHYESEESDSLIAHLRSQLGPEIQKGWNLYAYKVRLPLARSEPIKPDADQELIHRNRWNRYFLPLSLISGALGIFRWWQTGQPWFLLTPLPVLAILLWIRAMTPKQGMVANKLSASGFRENGRFLVFLLLWGVAGTGGIVVHASINPGQSHLDAPLAVGAILWIGILLFEAFREDRRRALVDRQAAELAAKERGEPPDHGWGLEP